MKKLETVKLKGNTPKEIEREIIISELESLIEKFQKINEESMKIHTATQFFLEALKKTFKSLEK